jgi:hypothetical protein
MTELRFFTQNPATFKNFHPLATVLKANLQVFSLNIAKPLVLPISSAPLLPGHRVFFSIVLKPLSSFGSLASDLKGYLKVSVHLKNQVEVLCPIGTAPKEFKPFSATNQIPQIKNQTDFIEILEPVSDLNLVIEPQNGFDLSLLDYVVIAVVPQKNEDPSLSTAAQNNLLSYHPISQYSFSGEIQHRICCPTSLLMLDDNKYSIDISPYFINACKNEFANAFGVWPQNIMQFSRLGYAGLCLALSSLNQLQALLNVGYRLAISLAWNPGELNQSFLKSTAGHFMVPERVGQTEIQVLDPAAPTPQQVRVKYPAAQFEKLWIRHGGICLVFFKK